MIAGVVRNGGLVKYAPIPHIIGEYEYAGSLAENGNWNERCTPLS